MTSRKIEEDMAQKSSREAKNTLGRNKDSHTHTLCSTTGFFLGGGGGGAPLCHHGVYFRGVGLGAGGG